MLGNVRRIVRRSALMGEVNSASEGKLVSPLHSPSPAEKNPLVPLPEDVACNAPSWTRRMGFTTESCWFPLPPDTRRDEVLLLISYPACVTEFVWLAILWGKRWTELSDEINVQQPAANHTVLEQYSLFHGLLPLRPPQPIFLLTTVCFKKE